LQEFVELAPKRALSANSWLVKVADIVDTDISAKNPNTNNGIDHLPPSEICEFKILMGEAIGIIQISVDCNRKERTVFFQLISSNK